MKQTRETVVLLNFGCNDIQKFARAIRDRHIYTMVMPYTVPIERVSQENPVGLIICADAAAPARPEAMAKLRTLPWKYILMYSPEFVEQCPCLNEFSAEEKEQILYRQERLSKYF